MERPADPGHRATPVNPLLSSAVTGVSIQDLTHHAVLLPARIPDSLNNRAQNTSSRNTDASATARSNDNNANIIPTYNENVGLNVESRTAQSDTRIKSTESKSRSTDSKALPKSEDHFDVNEYFARLQGTRYVSAPINAALEDKNANLEEAEENLEEINLLEDSRSNSSPNVQQSLTADIAQNFSQLPQVLPQVANAVFSSFSSYLNLNKSREETPTSDYGVQSYGNQDSNSGQALNVPMFAPDLTKLPIEEKPPAAVGPPPIGGATNTFRMTTKKKTYAHIPGLSSGDINASHISPFNIPHKAADVVPPYSTAFLNPSIETKMAATSSANIYNPATVDMTDATDLHSVGAFSNAFMSSTIAQSNAGVMLNLSTVDVKSAPLSTHYNPLDTKHSEVAKDKTGPESSAVMTEISESQLKDVVPTGQNIGVNISDDVASLLGDVTNSSGSQNIVENIPMSKAQHVELFYPAREPRLPDKSAPLSYPIMYQSGYQIENATLTGNIPPMENLPRSIPTSENLPPSSQLPSTSPLTSIQSHSISQTVLKSTGHIPQPGMYSSFLHGDSSSANVPPAGIPPPSGIFSPIASSNTPCTVPSTGTIFYSVPSSNLPPTIPPTSLPPTDNLPPPPTSFPPTGMLPPTGSFPLRSSSSKVSILPPSLARKIGAQPLKRDTSGTEPNIFIPQPPANSNVDAVASVQSSFASVPMVSNVGASHIFTPYGFENSQGGLMPTGFITTPHIASTPFPTPVEEAPPVNVNNPTPVGATGASKPSETMPAASFLNPLSIGINVHTSTLQVSQGTTTEMNTGPAPTFFNPAAFGQDTHTQSLNTSCNISQPSISQARQETSKPPLEPPKMVPAGQNFRLGNKRRPQYYSGPIEGTGHIGNMVKPILEPVLPVSNNNLSLFTPAMDPLTTENRDTSQQPYDIVQNQTVEFQASVTPSIAQALQQTYDQAQYEATFDLSRRTEEVYSGIEFPSNSSNFAVGQSHNEPRDDTKDLFGSLKSKLSSVNMNKLQSAVTTFFDPAYYEADKKEPTYDNNTNNLQYGQPSNVNSGQNQTYNLEISVASHDTTQYQQPQTYATPYHYPVGYELQTHNYFGNHQILDQYGYQNNQTYGNYVHSTSSESYDNSSGQYSTPQNYPAYDSTEFCQNQAEKDIQNVSWNTNMSRVPVTTATDSSTTDINEKITDHETIKSQDTQADLTNNAAIDNVASYVQDPCVNISNIEIKEAEIESNFDKEKKDTNILDFFSQSNPNDFFESGDRSNFTVIHSEVTTESNIKSLKEVDSELQANMQERRESNKNSEENTFAITTQMIENIISPMQFCNPVEEPLKERTSGNNDKIDEDTDQIEEISAETIDIIRTQTSNGLLEKENEDHGINNNESNMYFDEAYGNYGWSMKLEDKVLEQQQEAHLDYYIRQKDNKNVGFKDDPLNITNASDEIKAELKHVSQEDLFPQAHSYFLPRQMSVPTAPPAEDMPTFPTQDVVDVRAGLDVNLIEQDAKKDFQDLLNPYVVEYETDDGKLEKEKSVEPSPTEVEDLSKAIDNMHITSSLHNVGNVQGIHKFNIAPGSPLYESYKKHEPIFREDNAIVDRFSINSNDPIYENVKKIIETPVNEEPLPGNYQAPIMSQSNVDPIHENIKKISSPVVSFASYFDTGNYAADNYLKNSQYKLGQSDSTVPTLESNSDSIEIQKMKDHDEYRVVSTTEQHFTLPGSFKHDENIPAKEINVEPDANISIEKRVTEISEVAARNVIQAAAEPHYVYETFFNNQNIPSNVQQEKNISDTPNNFTQFSHQKLPKEEPLFPAQDTDPNKQALTDHLLFFSSTESSVQETNKEQSFNLLASYFTIPANEKTKQPDPQRPFFELSEGQDHYMHPSQNPKTVLNPKPHLWKHGKKLRHKSFQASIDENDSTIQDNSELETVLRSDVNIQSNKSVNDKIDETNIPQLQSDNTNVLNESVILGDINIRETNKAEYNLSEQLQPNKSQSGIDEDYDSILANFLRNNLVQCIDSVIRQNRTTETNRVGLEIHVEHNTEEPMDSDGVKKGKSADLRPEDSKNFNSHRPKAVAFKTMDDDSDDVLDDGGVEHKDVEEKQYRPVCHHWFYRSDKDNKSVWKPFTRPDSEAIEEAFKSPGLNESTVVATDGGRFDVKVMARTRAPVYWTHTPTNVRSWFYKGTADARYIPYTEAVADLLEEGYRIALETGEWDRRIMLPEGERVTLHGPTHIVHYPVEVGEESWANQPVHIAINASLLINRVYRGLPPKLNLPKIEPKKIDHLILMVHGVGCHRKFLLVTGNSFCDDINPQNSSSAARPRVVRRGVDEAGIEDPEPSRIDHLLLLCHGIGSGCDLRFRSLEEVVEDFRAISLLLTQSHYRNSYEQDRIGRVEVLPVSWHSSLHSGKNGVDSRMAAITLESCPRLRSFNNDTILDVLFYTSPLYCQSIVNTVGAELERIYKLFVSRNPSFSGGVSLGGHSLGSLILFDLLCHQRPPSGQHQEEPMRQVKYVSGVSGAYGNVKYPQLSFKPRALYALGSPIGIFMCVRGVESLGEGFSLPTCPNFFNIFHPFDPIAYRVEPLINPILKNIPPSLIPHHKGRKRMHLELKDTMARVGGNLKARLVESVLNTWNNVWGGVAKPPQPTNGQLEKAIEEQLQLDDEDEPSVDPTPSTISTKAMRHLGRLNGGRRVDHVLQEAPIETINEYLFAATSHMCYWESEDTMLLILREIYTSLGVEPDSTVPQQTMSVEVQRNATSPGEASPEQASTSRA